MADYGEAKPAPETLSMLLGKYLGEGAEAVGSIFPPSNPYGQAVKNLLLGDVPETARRLEEGEPYVLMDTRAGRQLIKPEALEVAGFMPVGEVAKGAGLAAKALGAKESSLLGMLGATAYHGSPYKFAPTERNPLGEFDPSKIGTGEGSQRFAHGFYAGEVPKTASSYAAMVAKPGTSRSGSEQFVTDALIKLNALKFTNGDVQELAGLIEKHPSAFAKPEEMLERIKTYSGNNPVGYVYKLDIPDEQIEKMLRWDKPMSEQPESVKKALMPEVDYRGLHTAPMKDSGAPLYDLTGAGQVYPDDVYSSEAYRYYGHGEPAQDRALFSKIQSYKNKPEEKVVIYRAIPKDVYKNLLDSEKPLFNHGDWVTISKDYAKEHGESTLQGDYKIIHKTVRAKNLFTNGDSPYEYGLDFSTSGLHVDDPSISGGEAYERLAKTYGKKDASDWLYEHGIPGAEYLDESSRTSGQGTRNFVLFHPDVAKIIDVEEQKFAKGGSVQTSDYDPAKVDALVSEVLAMKEGGDVATQAREKAAAAWEGLKQMYEEAKDKAASENVLEGLKGTARAYTTDVLGMPADMLASFPVAPRESGNPYANAIRDLQEKVGDVAGSDWLAQKLGLYGEGLAHEAGRMFGPGAVKTLDPKVLELITYHGTPHRFPATERNPLGEFDASKIGTGEGAQSYGHGIYLAESPGVAKSYQTNLTEGADPRAVVNEIIKTIGLNRDKALARAKSWDEFHEIRGTKNPLIESAHEIGTKEALKKELARFNETKALGEDENIIAKLKDALDSYDSSSDTFSDSGLAVLRHMDKLLPEPPKGSFYKVDLPDEMIDRMLDLNAPIGKQSKSIQDLAKNLFTDFSSSEPHVVVWDRPRHWSEFVDAPEDLPAALKTIQKITGDSKLQITPYGEYAMNKYTGEDLYELLAKKFEQEDEMWTKLGKTPEDVTNIYDAASQYLAKQGIPGNKYFDRASRDAGEGTRNFVIFPGEEKNLNILERKARGGAVDYDPDKIARLMAKVLE